MLCKLTKDYAELVIIAVVIFIINGCDALTNDGIIDICNRIEGGEFGVRESSNRLFLYQLWPQPVHCGSIRTAVSWSWDPLVGSRRPIDPVHSGKKLLIISSSPWSRDMRSTVTAHGHPGASVSEFLEGQSAFWSKITKPPEFTLSSEKNFFFTNIWVAQAGIYVEI